MKLFDIIADRVTVISQRLHQHVCVGCTPHALYMLPVRRIRALRRDQSCMRIHRRYSGQCSISFRGIEDDRHIVIDFGEDGDDFDDLGGKGEGAGEEGEEEGVAQMFHVCGVECGAKIGDWGVVNHQQSDVIAKDPIKVKMIEVSSY